MMSKLSGVLAAPAIAFIMLYKLWSDFREKKDPKPRIGSYALFGLIVFPLGLFFPLRNLILFNVPLTYMPKVGEELTDYTLVQRIFDIRTLTPFACMEKNGNPYDEFNIFLLLIKTGLTGEYDLSVNNPKVTPFAWILFISGVLLFISVIILFIYVLFTDRFIKDVPLKIFFVILIMTGILFMLRLMFKAPNFSSGDLRYIAWITVPAALLPGLYIEKRTGAAAALLEVLSVVFVSSSAAVYFLLK